MEQTEEWVTRQYGPAYLRKFFPNLDSAHVETQLALQWNDFVNGFGVFAGRDAQLDSIRACYSAGGGGASPNNELAAFWRGFAATRAPHLAHVALSLLSICATEAAVERSFSQQSLVHSKSCSRMYGDAIQSLMMLRFNRDVINASNARPAAADGPALSFTARELQLLPDGDPIHLDDDDNGGDDEQDANLAIDAIASDADSDTTIESAVPAVAVAAAATAAAAQRTAAKEAVDVAAKWQWARTKYVARKSK
jgi:hypothetical protein